MSVHQRMGQHINIVAYVIDVLNHLGVIVQRVIDAVYKITNVVKLNLIIIAFIVNYLVIKKMNVQILIKDLTKENIPAAKSQIKEKNMHRLILMYFCNNLKALIKECLLY